MLSNHILGKDWYWEERQGKWSQNQGTCKKYATGERAYELIVKQIKNSLKYKKKEKNYHFNNGYRCMSVLCIR